MRGSERVGDKLVGDERRASGVRAELQVEMQVEMQVVEVTTDAPAQILDAPPSPSGGGAADG